MLCVCVVERLNENLRKRINAVTEYIGTICSPFKQNNNVRYNTHSYTHIHTLSTQCYCCQWHERVFGIENIFLWYYIFTFKSIDVLRKLTFLVSGLSLTHIFSRSLCDPYICPDEREKKHHYKINFYSPCDKCYAYGRQFSVHFVQW